MKKLLLTILFLSIAPCSAGPKDKVENFNLFGEVIGEFNCTSRELQITGGDNINEYPLNKWLSKQDIIDLSETEEVGLANYNMIKGFTPCE